MKHRQRRTRRQALHGRLVFPIRNPVMRVLRVEAAQTAKSNWEGLTIETELERDGRWIAEVMELPGVLVYGQTQRDAIAKAKVLALRVLAERLEHGEPTPQIRKLFRHKASLPSLAKKSFI